MPRYTPCILLCVLACVGGCGRPPASASVPVVDFIKEFNRAETSPAGSTALVVHIASGTPHPSISAPVPGRIIWQQPLPRHGVFHALVALDGSAGARLRVGVSDDRVYEERARVRLTADRRDWTSSGRRPLVVRRLEVEPILPARSDCLAGRPQRRHHRRGAKPCRLGHAGDHDGSRFRARIRQAACDVYS